MAKEYQSFSYTSFVHNGQVKDFHFTFSQKKSPEQTIVDKRKNTFNQEVCKIIAYEPQFDIDGYRQLENLRINCPQEYIQKKQSLDAYTKKQLQTHIGERCNVVLSRSHYEIKDGHMYGDNTTEPFIQMVTRGRDYRKIHGNPIDHPRETAEVQEIQKVENVLCDRTTPVGTMLLAISPPGKEGSTYTHNFYDIFTLKERDGKKYIETHRYSSGLGYNQYADKIKQIQPDYFSDLDEKMPADAYYLARPIDVSKHFFSPDQVHAFLHKEHPYMDTDEFEKVLTLCEPFIHTYIQALATQPVDKNLLLTTYNAILNQADRAAGLGAQIDEKDTLASFTLLPPREVIYALGRQPVRQVTTGCGSSGGFQIGGKETSFSVGISLGVTNKNPMSVAEFGSNEDKFGSLRFACPHCQQTNQRERNTLLSNCQHCGKDVRC